MFWPIARLGNLFWSNVHDLYKHQLWKKITQNLSSLFCTLHPIESRNKSQTHLTCLILAARSERGGCWPLTPTTPTWESSWGNGGGCRGVAFDKANDFGDAGVLIIVDPFYAVVIANLPHVFRQSFRLRKKTKRWKKEMSVDQRDRGNGLLR